MSQKPKEEKLLERSSIDIIGLIPKRILDQLVTMGFYYIEPFDAYPFKLRVMHKLGFECILEADTEENLIKEGASVVELMGPTLTNVLINVSK